MINRELASVNTYEFNLALALKRPKSFLTSVSACANGRGGTLYFELDDELSTRVQSNTQFYADKVSCLIKESITPIPNFSLSYRTIDCRLVLVLTVSAGRSTPYYYKADVVMEAYIQRANDNIIAPQYELGGLLLKGINMSYDALDSEYDFKDFCFSKLRERYWFWTGESLSDKFFVCHNLCKQNGKLTNAGLLLADTNPVLQSRLFCTRWDGIDKSGANETYLDSAEYSGSLIKLLEEGLSFIRCNMREGFKKTSFSRIDLPDYCKQSFYETLVNALIHRDYLIIGSEVHIDIFDDRLTITSPGSMVDGSIIQERDIYDVAPICRNPVIADIFSRLGFMQCQGSGLKKITHAYHVAYKYRDELAPNFYSDASSVQVTLYNLNYGTDLKRDWGKKVDNEAQKVEQGQEKVDFDLLLSYLKLSKPSKDNVMSLFAHFGYDNPFTRLDVIEICDLAPSSASKMLGNIKDLRLIAPAPELGRGKYVFLKQK